MFINRLQLHPYMQDYVDALPSAEPAVGYYHALNNVVRYLVNSGLWQQWLSFGVLSTNKIQNALVDLRNPAHRFALNGSPGAFTPYAAMKGDGVVFHLDTGINTSALGLLDHLFGLHCQDDTIEPTGGHGVRSATGQIALQTRRTATQAALWSASVGATILTSTTGIGLKAVGRTQNSAARFYINDTAQNVNLPAAGFPTQNFLIFRQGVANAWNVDAISCFFIGHSQGVTDGMLAGFYRVWVQALAAFATLAVPATPQRVVPPHCFRAATHDYVTPSTMFIIRQFPPLPPDNTSDSTTIFASDPIDVAVSRPWSTGNLTSTQTRMKLAELVWGDRNNAAGPPINKPNDSNGAITYTVPGMMQTAVILAGGAGYGSAPVFQQIMPAGFTCTLHVTAGVIDGATIATAGHDYPMAGTLTLADSTGAGAVINYTSDITTGAVTALAIAAGGASYTAPAGSIVVGTGTGYSLTAVVDAGVVKSVLLDAPGQGFPLSGFFTFAAPGSGARGAFGAANTVYTCQPEFMSYDTSEISTDVKLAITCGLKYRRDTRHPLQWGWRNYLTRLPGLFDPAPWDALADAQTFDANLSMAGGYSSATPGGVVDASAAGLPYAMLVDLEVTEGLTGPPGAQLAITLQTAAATGGPWSTLGALPAIGLAQLATAGWQMPTFKVRGAQQRYLRLLYQVTGGPFTAGKITTNTLLDAFRLAGTRNLGACSPWGYWSTNAGPATFPNQAQNGLSRTTHDCIIPGQARLADVDNVPVWGVAMDCEMDDDAPSDRFAARVRRWVDIVRCTGFKIYLGMDPIVGGSGARVGMKPDVANGLAQLVDYVNILSSAKPPNGDQRQFIMNQVDVYRGPDGTLALPAAHMMVQINIGSPVIGLDYVTTCRTVQDELGIKAQLISPAGATLGGPSSRPENQAITTFCQIQPGGIFVAREGEDDGR